MNRKIRLLAGCVLFAVLLGGAYILYDRFSDTYYTGGLVQDSPGFQSPESTDNESKDDIPRPDTDAASENEPAESETDTEAAEQQEMMLAPDFTVYDLDENPVLLSDMLEKPVVLNFWASWCPPCKAEMPHFETAFETYGEEISFMMVNATDGARETVDIASAYITEQGYTFPVYYDTDGSANVTYRVTSLPITFFIDADGYLIAHAMGSISADILELGISMIID